MNGIPRPCQEGCDRFRFLEAYADHLNLSSAHNPHLSPISKRHPHSVDYQDTPSQRCLAIPPGRTHA
jgi:hypothetical protein